MTPYYVISLREEEDKLSQKTMGLVLSGMRLEVASGALVISELSGSSLDSEGAASETN